MLITFPSAFLLFGYVSYMFIDLLMKTYKNIKCSNEACLDKETHIKYIKYDNDNMKFIYICNHCGTKWLNTI